MENYSFRCKPLPGAKSSLMLKNPDRGLRMENYFNPYNCSGSPISQRNMDGYELLKNNISKYAVESPQLTQLYIYLIDYYDKDLDHVALSNLQKYFELLKEFDIKALLVFAYEYNEELGIGPTTDQILRHIKQLKPLLEKNRDIIHSMQAGFIGLWGEWHNSVHEHDKKTILNAILDVIPDDIFIQIRMVDYKNVIDDADERKKWISYADLYLVGIDHRWSISLFPDTKQYEQVMKECSGLLIDGEMPWGSDVAEVDDIDGILMAKRLQKQHFTSLSLEHNYRESGYFVDYAMKRWQSQMVSENFLKTEKIRFAPDWFLNEYGKKIKRPIFEYIRDHLGYLIMVTDGSIHFEEEELVINITLQNYGFSAPHGMKSIKLVYFTSNGKTIKSYSICEMASLQPAKQFKFNIRFKLSQRQIEVGSGVGVSFTNSAGIAARLYNDVLFEDGINKIFCFE